MINSAKAPSLFESHATRRFWRNGTDFESLDDEGFFAPTRPDFAGHQRAFSTHLENLASWDCLVLLGEPGLGKSHAARQAQDRFAAIHPDDLHHLVDLKSVNDAFSLVRRVFDCEIVHQWKNDESAPILNLWLDSLDESLLELNSSHLIEELRELNPERFRLRICCRSAVWPDALKRFLLEFFGEDNLAVLQLCSLTQQDVGDLAQWMKIDAETFLSWVKDNHLGTLAARPLTLRFLLKGYGSGAYSSFAQVSRSQVFYQGCLQLADEHNPSRQEGRKWKLSPERRLMIAAHIAAITILSARPFISEHFPVGNSLPQFVAETKLWEAMRGTDYCPASAAEMREVLDTALFRNVELEGQTVFIFSHRTYAEFLAAHFLKTAKVPEPQIWGLLLGGNAAYAGSVGVVPQLSETAAWLCADRPDFLRKLIEVDVHLLMTSNVALDDVAIRKKLVTELLALVEAEKEWDSSLFRENYKRLDHPDLADQLRPFIVDRTKQVIPRRVAIDIAERCPFGNELADLLADIAVDKSEDVLIRQQAAYAVKRIGKVDVCVRLKPLALEPQPADSDDELKGIALGALWPDHISVQELFRVLTPPQSGLLGAYRTLAPQIAAGIKPQDLPDVLRWCARHGDRMAGESHRLEFSSLLGFSFDLACQHLNQPKVAPLLAKALVPRFENFDLDTIWAQQTPAPNDDERRVVLIELARLLSSSNRLQLLIWKHGPFAWANAEDRHWLLEKLKKSRNAATSQGLARLLRILFDVNTLQSELEFTEEIFELTSKIPAASAEFGPLFQVGDVSPAALQKRRDDKAEIQKLEAKRRSLDERYDQRQRKQEEMAQQKPHQVLSLLQKCNQGEFSAWPLLNTWLLYDGTLVTGIESDLTDTNWWKAADESEKSQLLQAAANYLCHEDPQTATWIGDWNTPTRSIAASGHRALLLLFMVDKGIFDSLPDDVLARWAPAVLWFPWFGGEVMAEDEQALLAALHQRVPQDIALAIRHQLEIEASALEFLSVTRKLRFNWSQELHQELFDIARHGKLGASHLHDLLSTLLEYEMTAEWVQCMQAQGSLEVANWKTPARALAVDLLETEWQQAHSAGADDGEKSQALEKAFQIALALLDRAGDGGWDEIWPLLQADDDWGKQLVNKFSEHDHAPMYGQFLSRMPAEAIADWYLWMWKWIKPKDIASPRKSKGKSKAPAVVCNFLSPADHLFMFCEGLITRLRNRGSFEALSALERIQSEIPDHWVKYSLPDARRLARAQTWQPPTPQELVFLLKQPESRLVRDGDDLLQVVLESLARLDQELQDETPAAVDFWNTSPHYKPKTENEASDVIKRFLARDIKGRGIIIGREVEIRRGEGDTPGERTDLHISAVTLPNPVASSSPQHEEVRVIVEVKGAWNDELKTAMKAQLCDRYLQENKCNHGLYLVIWPQCSQWHTGDSRRKKSPKLKLEEARTLFTKQANTLSTPDQQIAAFVLNAALR